MKNKLWYLLVVVFVVFTLAASASAGSTNNATSSGSTHTITDMAGADVTIPTNITKVANMWPASNSVMLCLGDGDLLVGTMDLTKKNYWSKFVYPDIVNVPTVSDNAEEMMKLDPDLIITPTQVTAEKFRSVGLPAIDLYFNNYSSMKKAFTLLGGILGGTNVEKAEKWSNLIDSQIATVKAAIGDIPEEKRPLVYYIQGQTNQGLYATFPGDSIMGDWCDIAGGEFASKKLNLTLNGEVAKVNSETILSMNPDVIIIGGFAQHDLYKELMSSPEWKDINAVKNNRVYTNPNGLFPWERFGMESALQIPFAASVIHPELFKVNLIDEVKNFYKEFMDIELTDKQAQNMIDGYGPNGEEYKN